MTLARTTAVLVAAALLASPVLGQGWMSRGISLEQSEKVADALTTGVDGCLGIPVAYHPDCIEQVFRDAVRKMENNADYWEAEVALTRVVRKTDRMVRSMKDESADRMRHDGHRLRAVTAPVGARRYVLETVTEAASAIAALSPYEVRLFAPILQALKDVSLQLETTDQPS